MGYILPLEQFCKRVAAHPEQPYLLQPNNRQWQSHSWEAVNQQARKIAQGLLSNGLRPGDKVAILGKNSAEWVMADLAIMMAGLVSVPIYDTAGAETISYVLKHSDSKAIFIGKLQDFSAANQAIEGYLSIGFPYTGIQASHQWADWLTLYAPLASVNIPNENDLATLVYTSGSEGLPKGVALTYKNLAAQALCFVKLLPNHLTQETQRLVSYLPMAHITERSFVSISSLYFPLCIYFVESINTFIDDLVYAKPTIFLSVPRLWVKFQGAILGKLPQKRLDMLLKIPVIKKWISAKIRSQLGFKDTVLYGCGSAPISQETLHWYAKIGVNISEGWGMTETTGAACINLPFQMQQLGTIGKPIPGIEMKVSAEGEILIRGDAVFKEYYLDPQRTLDAFVAGWFKTGDCGELNEQGAWKITGRVKEQFKTSKGKYVAPVPIENLLTANTAIEQVCVLGEGRKQPIALIVLNDSLKQRDPQLTRNLESTLENVNHQLEHHQQLDHLIVISEPWTIENQLLTPTLKLKRNKINERYRDIILEDHGEKVVWQ